MSSRGLIDKLRDSITETQQAGLILPRHMSILLQEIDDERLDFRVPYLVTARIIQRDDTDYAFDVFRCSECGNMFSFQDAVQMHLKCNICSSKPYLSQAPIFVANFRDRPPVPIAFSEAVQKVTYDWNSGYCIYKTQPLPSGTRLSKNFLKGLKEADNRRPIDSLCWTCSIPQVPCDWRDSNGFCRFSRYDNAQYRNWRQDLWASTGGIRLVPPPARTRSAFGRFVDRYRPITVSEGITKPIKIAIHDFAAQDAQRVQFHQDELRGVEEILYVKKLEIFQFTIALAIGLPYVSIRRRAVRLLSDTSPDGTESYFLLSRRLVTEGVVIKLRNDVVNHILDDWSQDRPDIQRSTLAATLYHTASHAFLKPLPMMSGLDASEFHESFSASDNEIAVYDNSPGGIGGVRTLFEESTEGLRLRGDYSAQLLNSLSCQLDCSWSCKACLHTGNCGWINRQLKRERLEEIIDERLRDRYFSV